MPGNLYIVRGDITQLAADAIAYSADGRFDTGGDMYPAFARNVAGFAEAYRDLRAKYGQSAAGNAYWLPLQRKHPAGVAVAVSVGDASGGAAAVTAALQCAQRGLGELGRRPLLALPTFLTGGGGLWADRARAATAQLRAAYRFLDEADGVDVAVVAYTEGTYQIFLEARRQLGRANAEGLRPSPALVSAILQRECVLFMGAGVSSGSGLPDWSALIDELENRLGLTDHRGAKDLDHFLDVAEWFRQERPGGHQELVELIHDRFSAAATGAVPTLAHYFLTSLPVRYVVTTNYDDLVERALAAQRRFPVKVVSEPDVALTGSGSGTFVIKLHGDADAAKDGKCSVVLGRDDYDDFFRKRPAMATLLEGLLLNQTFFFVGYGLRDPDFRAIFSRISSMLAESRRPAYATSFKASQHMARQWERKRLHLLEIPGENEAQKQCALLRFLDQLAEAATGDPQLFLAKDAPIELSPALVSLRDKLSEAGKAVAEACRQLDLPAEDALRVASVLEFLVAHGWRPDVRDLYPGSDLHNLYAMLADALRSRPEAYRRLLVGALATARDADTAAALRERLEKLER